MRKTSTFYFFLLNLFLVSLWCQAQKQANKWYFGNHAAIDFNSGAPVPFAGSAMYILEGCASIADTAGQTLFYTNGVNVWNKNNIQMPNGFGLLGDDNAAQSAIIVPAPGSTTLYYIFTAPTNGNLPMHYSVVDMTMQGGLGDVQTKNVFMFNNSTEKVTAVFHSNGTDIWIIGHQYLSNNFYAYLLTTTGLNPVPVITPVGTVHNGTLGFAGYMKGSHNGKKLAYAITISLDIVELFDFDNSTGIPSNPITFNNIQEAYGLEFSPDDSKLYATEENPQLIIQWDISLSTAAAITASQTVVGTGSGSGFAALQLAPDGKIYLAKRMSIPDLGVINSPNSAGLASNFVDHAVNLVGGSSEYGLPNFFQGFFNPPSLLPVASFSASDTILCAESGGCVNFNDLSTNNPTSWKWLFPGASPDSTVLSNPLNICYSNPGTYSVTLIATNAVGSDTVTVSSMITVVSSPPPPVITVIGGDTLTTGTASSYQWYFNGSPIPGATDSFYVANQSGTYSVVVVSDGCSSLSSGVLITSENVLSGREIEIYPNPVRSQLCVLSLGFDVGELATIGIFNMLGEMVYELQTPNSKQPTVLDVSGLSNGSYLLRIYLSQGRTINKKLVIMH